MLKPKVLSQILEQANTHGVQCTMILKPDGSLLAFSGNPIAKTIAAIIANIWSEYTERSQGSVLEYQIIDCEEGRVVVTRVSKLLVCVCGDLKSEFGMLKSKATVLRNYLEAPLSQIVK